MKKVLVPLDGSPLSEVALDHAAEMVDNQVDLILMRAAPSGSGDEASNYVETLAHRFREENPTVHCSTRVVEESPADAILDVAEQEKVGLIIMTTHGRGGLKRWLMGSVAEKVVRHAPCPVLTVGRRSLEQGQLLA